MLHMNESLGIAVTVEDVNGNLGYLTEKGDINADFNNAYILDTQEQINKAGDLITEKIRAGEYKKITGRAIIAVQNTNTKAFDDLMKVLVETFSPK